MAREKKIRKGLYKDEADALGLSGNKVKPGTKQYWYYITQRQWIEVLQMRRKKEDAAYDESLVTTVAVDTVTNQYSEKAAFNATAWNKKGYMMDIDEYCETYKLPREDVMSYKLVTHTGTPFYNIAYRDRKIEDEFDESFIEEVVKKYASPLFDTAVKPNKKLKADFDVLTFTDAHIGMDTDARGNSMYKNEWNEAVLFDRAKKMVEVTLAHQKSNVLYIDDLGDLLDGQDGKTVRKGHDLPQNMTNEEMFDTAYKFKIYQVDNLAPHYTKIVLNIIVNDNHAGTFAYYAARMFQEVCKIRYNNVKVVIHRQFINHYETNHFIFLISHGKDDITLKYGFKVHLDSGGMEKIDQYCKRHGLYKKGKQIIFKKGDSHQALFDMCTSDDFFYFNYPALSPSSNWIKNNFKLGRCGFVLESYRGSEWNLKPYFFQNAA